MLLLTWPGLVALGLEINGQVEEVKVLKSKEPFGPTASFAIVNCLMLLRGAGKALRNQLF